MSTLATRLAALQQGLAAPTPVGSLCAARTDGGLTPKPPPQAARPTGYAEREQTSVLAARSVDGPREPEAEGRTRGSEAGAGRPLRHRRHPILIGASKSQPAELLEEAITLGLSDFGENKVQEAQSKWPALKARRPHVRLHLIGPLQSNKAADAVALFDVIHSIDRVKIADALAAACEKLGYLSASRTDGGLTPKPPPHAARPSGYAEQNQTVIAKKAPQFLIQVNTGEEPQKAGVSPRETAALLAHCQKLGLDVIGLMCVPPEGENPAPHFALLKKMADELGLAELSMGMSGDYETALRLGSTMIRVGTALFGARERAAF